MEGNRVYFKSVYQAEYYLRVIVLGNFVFTNLRVDCPLDFLFCVLEKGPTKSSTKGELNQLLNRPCSVLQTLPLI